MKRNASFAVTQAMELAVPTVQRENIGMAAARINVFGAAILPRVAAVQIVRMAFMKNEIQCHGEPLPTLWRLHLRSASKNDGDYSKVVDYCIDNQVAGIGWPLAGTETAPSRDEYIAKTKARWGSVASINFARDVRKNDLIWVRGKNGIYYLGRIDGDWRYSDASQALALDIPNQRPCHWIEVGSGENVPGKIVACFRPTRALQKISDDRMLNFSMWLYNRKAGNGFYPDAQNIDAGESAESFFEYIDDQDCEDIAGLFLQYKYGYFIIPSTCKRDTLGYEFVLTHINSDEPRAIIQVKQGKIDLNNRWVKEAQRVFLFSTKGHATVLEGKKDVVALDKKVLFAFVRDNLHMFPYRIRYWLSKEYQAI